MLCLMFAPCNLPTNAPKKSHRDTIMPDSLLSRALTQEQPPLPMMAPKTHREKNTLPAIWDKVFKVHFRLSSLGAFCKSRQAEFKPVEVRYCTPANKRKTQSRTMDNLTALRHSPFFCCHLYSAIAELLIQSELVSPGDALFFKLRLVRCSLLRSLGLYNRLFILIARTAPNSRTPAVFG